MLKIAPLVSEAADHAAHQALADVIATGNPSAAAESSRSHLTGLKEALT